MAETRRNSGVRRRLVNDIASEIQTLSAFWLRAQPGISSLRAAQPTVPRDFAQFTLPNGIADTDNHIANPYLYFGITIMRLVRNSELGSIGDLGVAHLSQEYCYGISTFTFPLVKVENYAAFELSQRVAVKYVGLDR